MRTTNPFRRVGIVFTLFIGKLLIDLGILWDIWVLHLCGIWSPERIYHRFIWLFGTGADLCSLMSWSGGWMFLIVTLMNRRRK